MIFVDQMKVKLTPELRATLAAATKGLLLEKADKRQEYIKGKRDATWGDNALVAALKAVVGNKCWYSEINLGGADPNVDHFRPKGRVVEVNDDMEKTGAALDGYWWLAFEPLNFRLSSQHANQRRVDDDSNGGKADFFPVKGDRAPELTSYLQIFEHVLPLDPCSPSDVSLIWFDPEGRPCYSPHQRKRTLEDELRIKATIWLYHLDKNDTAGPRAKAVEDVRRKLLLADNYYQMWQAPSPCLKSKASFDREVSEIAGMLADSSDFAGAKRCIVRMAMAEYDWIETCQALLI
jgi:hypothetical protein